MSKFSVKKPLTIFCAAVAILILGVIAYTRMTPDLLPSMDFPYVIIMTTDPGASPETVEETITKPMEQSMATLEHIKNIVSNSSANYSLVMLEFEDDVNLDTIGVDIQQKISILQAGWEDTVGTPYVLKINPSMIPVQVSAVAMKDMDVNELSDFVEDVLMPKLEGVSGVARVTASGIVQQELHVVISQDKIDVLNEQLADAINKKLDAAEAELNNAKNQLTNAISGAMGALEIPELDEFLPDDATMDQLGDMIDEQVAKLEASKDQLNNAIIQLRAIQSVINDPMGALSQQFTELAQRQALEKELKQIEQQLNSGNLTEEKEQELLHRQTVARLQLAALGANSSLSKQDAENILTILEEPSLEQAALEQQIAAVEKQLEANPEDQKLQAELQVLRLAVAALESDTVTVTPSQASAILNILGTNSTLDQSAADKAQRAQLEQELKEIDSKLNAGNLSDGEYQELLTQRMLLQIQLSILNIDGLTLNAREIQEILDEQEKQIRDTLQKTVNEVDASIDGMVTKLAELQTQIDSLAKLAENVKNKNFGLDEIRSKYDEIAGQVSDLASSSGDLIQGIMSLSVAMMQIENGLSTLNASRDSALEQADLDNILSLQTVSQILAAQNFSMPAGYVEQDGISYMVSVGDEFTTEEQLGDLLLFDFGLDGVDPIYLRDVADIFLTDNSDSIYAKLNGSNGIMLSFEKQSNYATAAVSESIVERCDALESEYEGLEFYPLMDQGDYIDLVVSSILESLGFGALFAILILFLFLRDIRPTFITLCSIPLSLVFAIVLMYFSGVTLNIISLSGLSIAVGMLVDNSVVVIENIYRLRSNGANAIQAAVSGARQVSGAITASTLTTICVFLPIVFVDGITRELFTDLALTMSYALLASLIIALTLVPAMASGMLKKDGKPKKDIMAKVYDKYCYAGSWALDHKAIVFLLAIALLIGSAGLSLYRGFTFMPEVDANTVSGTITFDEETDMAEAMEIADQVLERVDTIEGIETVGAMMGSTSLMSSGGTSVTLYVTLPEGVSGSGVAEQITQLCADLPCEVSCSSSMMDMSMLTGSGVSIDLYGNDMTDLQEAARTVAGVLETVEGTQEVSDGLEDAATALHVTIDRNKAMAKGYTVAQVYMQLATSMTTSATATSFYLDGAGIDVIVETPEADRVTVSNLADQEFTQTDAEGNTTTFKLSDIADVEETVSLNTIQRNNQRRYLTVSAGVADGYNVTKVTSAVQKALADVELPDGVTMEFSGENETIMEAMQQLVLMLLLGMLLVYFVMVAQFQSLKSPFIVMFTIPLAFTGGFLALLLTGMEVSIIAMIGFVMLTGIIVNNGIVLVDYINQLRLEGMDRREAILEAGVTRIRPILMTSLTTILGLAVMAMGRDAGTALMQPMAVVCIGGLLYATLMTLFVVPCIYDVMNKKDLRKVDEADLVILTD